jgi:hypothetical protein
MKNCMVKNVSMSQAVVERPGKVRSVLKGSCRGVEVEFFEVSIEYKYGQRCMFAKGNPAKVQTPSR